VEVSQTSDLWPLRLGEERKKEDRRWKETTGQKYNGPPLFHRAAIKKLQPVLVASYDIQPGNGEGLYA